MNVKYLGGPRDGQRETVRLAAAVLLVPGPKDECCWYVRDRQQHERDADGNITCLAYRFDRMEGDGT